MLHYKGTLPTVRNYTYVSLQFDIYIESTNLCVESFNPLY